MTIEQNLEQQNREADSRCFVNFYRFRQFVPKKKKHKDVGMILQRDCSEENAGVVEKAKLCCIRTFRA